VTVLVASALLVVLLPRGDAPFVAAAFLSAVGTLAVFAAILTDASPSEVASVTAAVSIAMVAWLPGLSARFARLPIGYKSPDQIAKGYDGERGETESVDFVKIGNQARRGHELLLGLVAGCSALVVGSAGVVLGFSDNVWAQLMALAAGITIMLRARLFDYTAQVACLTIAGILTIVLLILGIALHPPTEIFVELGRFNDSGPLNIRTVWFSSSIAAGAALLVGVGLVVPRKGVTPFWGRIFDIFDGLILLSLVPLCLAVLDVYSTVRGLTGSS
jgi:type VII secretion integral membrane protein EccD